MAAADFLKAAMKKGLGIGAGGDIGFGAGPATSGTGGVSFGSFSSGGGFNPFASPVGQSINAGTLMVIGAVMVSLALIFSLRKNKKRKAK